MKITIAFLLLLLIGCRERVDKIERVLDGDSFILSDGERVRLFETDCPEISQPWGKEAKAYAESQLLNKEVTITNHGVDRYGRTLISVEVDGVNFEERMVSRGFAWVYEKYARNEALIEKFNYAKENKVGLFQDGHISPYQFRKLKN